MKKYAGFVLTVSVVYIVLDWLEIRKERQYTKGYLEGLVAGLDYSSESVSKEEA